MSNTVAVVLRHQPDQILEHLFLGDEKDAYSKKTITRLGITHVVTVTMVTDFVSYKQKFPPGVKCLVVSVLDEADENIAQYFKRTNAFIDEGRKLGNVLVHCVWGISRSASFVIAYVMQHKGVDYRTAFRMVHRARPIVAPNSGFRQQLASFATKVLNVQFSIQYNTSFGQCLHIVGSHQSLGSWQVNDANRMQWSPGGVWTISLPVRGSRFEYKYVIVDNDTGAQPISTANHPPGVHWETCKNRVYEGAKKIAQDTWEVVTDEVTPHN